MAAVIGDPIAHSLSPTVHNAAFDAAGLDWIYVGFEVSSGDAGAAIDAMRHLGLGGLSVTMPHKEAVVASLEVVTADARLLNAVNCIAWDTTSPTGGLVGHNTDGEGFVRSVRTTPGAVPIEGARAAVLGAGGAARAIVVALAKAGAGDVAVLNRTASRATTAAQLAGDVGRVGGPADIASADLVVNATSVGMGGDTSLPCDPDLLHPGQTVVDIVYEPRTTPLLEAAVERGALVVGGVGMLVQQAAVSFELWTGHPAPLAAMASAAEAGLRG